MTSPERRQRRGALTDIAWLDQSGDGEETSIRVSGIRPRGSDPSVDAGETARAVAERARIRAELEGVDLAYEIEDGLPVLVDALLLEGILDSLLLNAMTFTLAPGRIDVGIGRDGEHARIDVRDTGRGIAPERLPHVFGMRRTERDGSASPTELATLCRLVELHGGSVRASSRGLRKGAHFTVLLPLA